MRSWRFLASVAIIHSMPDSLLDEWDACTAAPEFHRILFENDTVRTLETIIQPGQIVPLHTHCWHAVSTVLSWSDMVRRDEEGHIAFDSRASGVRREPGEAMWAEPFPLHTLENVGDQPIHIVTVEIKTRPVS